MLVASGHSQQNNLQAVADVALVDMAATCSNLVVDVGSLAYSLELAYDARILALELVWLGFHIRPLLPAESESFGLRSILAVVGCSADCRSEMGFVIGC